LKQETPKLHLNVFENRIFESPSRSILIKKICLGLLKMKQIKSQSFFVLMKRIYFASWCHPKTTCSNGHNYLYFFKWISKARKALPSLSLEAPQIRLLDISLGVYARVSSSAAS
jgi:hypothetical protein